MVESPESPRHWLWNVLGGLIPLVLGALAFVAIRQELSAHTFADVAGAMRNIPTHKVVLAYIMTALTYFCLGCYDVIALVYGGKVLPFRKTVTISTISFALANALGFNAVTGGLVRLRLYTRLGFTAADVARIAAFNLLTFWVGLGIAGGMALVLGHLRWPPKAPAWLPSPQIAGVFMLVAVVAYLFVCKKWPGLTLVRKGQVVVPPFRLGLGQAVAGTAEWVLSAAVLWALLPWEQISFGGVLGVFVVSLLLGLISTVPGGLGVFETSALFFLGHSLGTPRVLGVLLVFRLVYTLTPFVIALIGFTVGEIRHRKQRRLLKAV